MLLKSVRKFPSYPCVCRRKTCIEKDEKCFSPTWKFSKILVSGFGEEDKFNRHRGQKTK